MRSAHLSYGRLPRGLRACAHVLTTAFHFFGAETLGSRVTSQHVHARRNTSSQVTTAPLITLHTCRIYELTSWFTDGSLDIARTYSGIYVTFGRVFPLLGPTLLESNCIF
jgi:hypothetical protein